MLEPEDVSAILRLNELGWGAKRIAQELGISRNTAKEYIAAGGWTRTDNRGARRRSMAKRLGYGNDFAVIAATPM